MTVPGAVVGQLCALYLRGTPVDTGTAARCLRRYLDDDEPIEATVHAAHVSTMQRLLLAATSSSSAALASELKARFDPRTADRLVLRFVRDEVCNAMQVQLTAVVDTEGREGDECDDAEDECDDAEDEISDLHARMARSLLRLVHLAWIGSQEACPETKKLFRRIYHFLEVPDRALTFDSGLLKQGAPRSVKTDLAQRAPVVHAELCKRALLFTLMQCMDNAPYTAVTAAGLGEKIDASIVHATATGRVEIEHFQRMLL